MPRIQEKSIEEKKVGWKPALKTYIEYELRNFGEFLENYKTKIVTLPNGQNVQGYDWKKVYVDLGAKNEDGAVIVQDLEYKMNKIGEWHPDRCTVPLEEVENKIDQWKFFNNKSNWIEKKKISELEKMANQIGTKKVSRGELSRVALNDYKEKFGKEYVVPEGFIIIEDEVLSA